MAAKSSLLPHEQRYARAISQIAQAHCTLRHPHVLLLRQLIEVAEKLHHDTGRDEAHSEDAWSLARDAVAPLLDGLCRDVFPRMLAPRISKEGRAHLIITACKRLRDTRVIMEAQNTALRRALVALTARVLGGIRIGIVDENSATICRLANVYLRVIDECAHERVSYAVEIVDTLFTGMFSTVAEAKGSERDPINLLDGFAGAVADYERNERAKSASVAPAPKKPAESKPSGKSVAKSVEGATGAKRARREKEPASDSDGDSDSDTDSDPPRSPDPKAKAKPAPLTKEKDQAPKHTLPPPGVTLRPVAKRAHTEMGQPAAEETPRPSRRADTAPVQETKGGGTRVATRQGESKAPSVVVTPSLRRQLDRAAFPASSDPVPVPTGTPASKEAVAATPKETRAAEVLTDGRGVKVRVAQRGDPLPKLACIFVIED